MFVKMKVLELASVLAGPSVGQFFAELGAEVIKIENPKTNGDVTRSWLFRGEQCADGVSAYFSAVNWGKKSVELDLSSASGLEELYSLVRQSDIVISSFKPGDDRKLGVDFKTLKTIKEDIIYGHITGYGVENKRVGYDAVIQAESGFMSINGEKNGGPLKMPVALIDILAAHQLKEGLLLALIRKMTSGEGSYVHISLMEAAVSALANQGANWLVGNKIPQRTGNEHPNISPYGDVFETADQQQIIVAVGNAKQFQALSQICDLDLASSGEFTSNVLRVQNREKLRDLLTGVIKGFEAEVLLEKLHKHKVPAGRVKNISEVLEDGPQEWFHNSGSLKGVRSFFAIPEGEVGTKLHQPPSFGQHTQEVLKGLK